MVMHDAIWIVWNTKGWSIGVFLEVMFHTFLDVGPVDGNIVVSVISTLDMEGSKGMNEFMDDDAMYSKMKSCIKAK